MHIHNTQFLVYTPVPMIYAPQTWDLNLMFVFISKKTLNTKKSLREMLDVQKEHKSVVFTAVECQQNVIFALVFYLLKTSCSVKSSLEQTHGMILCWILDTGIHATMIPGIGILIGILGIPGMMILDTGIMGMIVMGLITGNNYI